MAERIHIRAFAQLWYKIISPFSKKRSIDLQLRMTNISDENKVRCSPSELQGYLVCAPNLQQTLINGSLQNFISI